MSAISFVSKFNFLFLTLSFLGCSGILRAQATFTVYEGDTINLTSAAGVKQGFWRYYWLNGDLKYEVYFENGEKEGLEMSYYDQEDCIEYSNTYKKGVLDGPSISFFKNCSTRCEEGYRNGLKQGYERCYDQNGYLLTEANFDKGELVGSYAHFDKKGYVTYESPTKETTLKFDKFITGEYKIKDSTIFKVFERNTSWKNVLMVVDMTGSMFPYIGQLLVWYKYTYESGKIRYYTLFNDGDHLADDKKVVGNTGGVHMYEAKDFKKFKRDIEETRKAGEGGDETENDLEAVYKSIGKFRDYKDIILVADDSPVRDMALLRRIKKPVHIIICGTAKGINAEYLRIAYRTKGSIHTANDDLDMKTLKDGQEFELDNDVFLFKNGDFVFLDVKR